jgi:hypothetical protein
MEKGRVVLCVRKALVTYLAERLGILSEIQGSVGEGRVRVIRCLNWKDLAPLVPFGG